MCIAQGHNAVMLTNKPKVLSPLMFFKAGGLINPYLIETPFNIFANRADLDQAALVRAALSGSALFAYGTIIYLILLKWN